MLPSLSIFEENRILFSFPVVRFPYYSFWREEKEKGVSERDYKTHHIRQEGLDWPFFAWFLTRFLVLFRSWSSFLKFIPWFTWEKKHRTTKMPSWHYSRLSLSLSRSLPLFFLLSCNERGKEDSRVFVLNTAFTLILKCSKDKTTRRLHMYVVLSSALKPKDVKEASHGQPNQGIFFFNEYNLLRRETNRKIRREKLHREHLFRFQPRFTHSFQERE